MPRFYKSWSGTAFQLVTANGATIKQQANGDMGITTVLGKNFIVASSTGVTNFLITDGGLINMNSHLNNYNNISTAGIGVPAIYKSSIQNPSNAAPTTVSYTPPAAAGTYRVLFYLDITTATTITFIAKLTYTDPAGTARSANIMLVSEGGTAVLAGGPAANTAGQWHGTQTFGIDASGTAITVADNAGTYTTCNYRWQVVIEQLV